MANQRIGHAVIMITGLISLLTLNACSVGLALSGISGPNLEAFRVGSTRRDVEAQLGSPLSSARNPQGDRTDLYEYTQKESRGDRALIHGFMDIVSGGFWEIFATPAEIGERTKCRLTVEYDTKDRVDAITPIGCLKSEFLMEGRATTWQDSREITPITYKSSDQRIKRSAGMLRRLTLVVFRDDNGARWESSPEAYAFLSDWRGYEIVPLMLYEDILCQRMNKSPAELSADLDSLVKWAKQSPDGASPSEEVAHAVGRIGRALNVDGLLVFRGGKIGLGADLYEVATGRIVWRGRRQLGDLSSGAIRQLLQSLEHAMPRALIDE